MDPRLQCSDLPHPLISAAAAAGIIVVFYLPLHCLSIILSPALLFALLLLSTLLRFGLHETGVNEVRKELEIPPEKERLLCEESQEWGGWGGALEIIYEEYDEEEEEEEDSCECSLEYSEFGMGAFEGFCCSESDAEREDAEELIEIALEEDHMFEIDLSA